MRHNRSQTRQRRSHHGLAALTLSRCPHCGAQGLRHRLCAACGRYRIHQPIDVAARQAKKEKKRRQRGETK